MSIATRSKHAVTSVATHTWFRRPVFEEPARWITCDVSAGPDRDRFLAELAQAIVHMGQLPIDPELDEV